MWIESRESYCKTKLVFYARIITIFCSIQWDYALLSQNMWLPTIEAGRSTYNIKSSKIRRKSKFRRNEFQNRHNSHINLYILQLWTIAHLFFIFSGIKQDCQKIAVNLKNQNFRCCLQDSKSIIPRYPTNSYIIKRVVDDKINETSS